jgi:hypothetical protein
MVEVQDGDRIFAAEPGATHAAADAVEEAGSIGVNQICAGVVTCLPFFGPVES